MPTRESGKRSTRTAHRAARSIRQRQPLRALLDLRDLKFVPSRRHNESRHHVTIWDSRRRPLPPVRRRPRRHAPPSGGRPRRQIAASENSGGISAPPRRPALDHHSGWITDLSLGRSRRSARDVHKWESLPLELSFSLFWIQISRLRWRRARVSRLAKRPPVTR